MPPLAIALVLTAAGLHAGWNRLLHDEEDRVAAMAVAGIVGSLILLPTILTAPPERVVGLTVLSGVAEVAYVLCLTAAYRYGALSLAYPIGRGTAPLLVTLGGWVVLAERPSIMSAAAAIALLVGLAALSSAGHQPERGRAVGFAVLTGCCIATYSLIDARAVSVTAPAGYLGVVLGIEGLLLLTLLRGQWSRVRSTLRSGVLIGIGTTAAYLLVLFAFQRAHAGQVATLREIAVLIGLLLAREKPSLRAWAGAALVVVGAALAAG